LESAAALISVAAGTQSASRPHLPLPILTQSDGKCFAI